MAGGLLVSLTAFGAIVLVMYQRASNDIPGALGTAEPITQAFIPVQQNAMEEKAAGEEATGEKAAAVEQTRRIGVAIAGAVKAPGFYELPEGARVQDLIDAAGGVSAGAEMEDINIAARLIDGYTLSIPAGAQVVVEQGRVSARSGTAVMAQNPPEYTRSGWSATATPEAPAPVADSLPARDTASSGLIHLNTASKEELESLPGIGPKTAEKIIVFRSQHVITSVDDLMQIQGVGEKKVESLRGLVDAQ